MLNTVIELYELLSSSSLCGVGSEITARLVPVPSLNILSMIFEPFHL